MRFAKRHIVSKWFFQLKLAGLMAILLMFVASGLISVVASESGNLDAMARRLEEGYRGQNVATLEPGAALNLDQYLHIAQLNSNSLRAAFYKFKAAVEKLGYAGAWADPRFSWGYFVENVETRVGPQEQRLSLSQGLTWPGKLDAKDDMAIEAARAAHRRFQAEQLRVTYRVKKAYYQYFLLGRNIELTKENAELLRYWESVVRTRYTVGLQKHPDLIKAQVELGILEDQLAGLEDKKRATAAMLLAELNSDEYVELPWPGLPSLDSRSFDEDSVTARMLVNNPDLQALEHLIEKEQAGQRLASKASYPDFNVGVTYIVTGEAANPLMNESGKDPWMLSASINLPLWFGQNGAKKKEAQARHLAAQYRREDAADRLETQVSRILWEYRDGRRQLALYGGQLIPQTEQLLNATFTSYQAGESDFLTLLQAQRQLLKFQLAKDKALVMAATKEAQLLMLMGYESNDKQ